MNEPELESLPESKTQEILSRYHHEPQRYEFLVTFDNDVMIIHDDELMSYQEAMTSLDSEKWLKTMKSEMQSMYDNQV